MRKKYGVQTNIEFELVEYPTSSLKSGLTVAGGTIAAGDIQISKDGSAFANATNTATVAEIGTSGIYSLVLTADEMSAARICIRIVDQTATKLWHDVVIWIETYGTENADMDVDDFKADVTNLDVAVSTRAPANEYDTEMARMDTTISSRLASEDYVVPDNASIADIESKIDTIDGIVDSILVDTAEIANLNDISVADILTSLGITEGGSWTLQKALKVITAWVAGNWRVKATDEDVQELIDPDDESTVILEQTLSTTTPYRVIEVKI